jgi:hypothetical protein
MLIKNGYKISIVAAFNQEKLQSEVLRINRNLSDPGKDIDQLIFHTVNLDTFGFESLIERIIAEFGFSKAVFQVIFPFFERIGILWQTGSIFVAHEHFVSNLIRNRLIRETGKLETKESDLKVLFFLRENEWHEMGLLYFNYLAAEFGAHCIYLGQSVPFSDLSHLLVNSKFDFICTSFTTAIEKRELEQYLFNLSLIFNADKILIAGRQISIHKPKLPSNVIVIKTGNELVKRLSA